ncbi:MAG TPA: PilN domain-containing protein, partial [Chitinivibrionales bacterium]|nr:PilN domain-containing protein [Chitinivibrionales bacterium]
DGRTLSFPEVANFMSRLSESNYIRGVDLSGIQEVAGTVKMFQFNLSCTINPDAQLEKPAKDTVAVKAAR